MNKEREILQKIVEIVNQGKIVVFDEDWGGNTITIGIDNAHTHCGAPDCSFENLIDDLHNLLVAGKGLNWVAEVSKD